MASPADLGDLVSSSEVDQLKSIVLQLVFDPNEDSTRVKTHKFPVMLPATLSRRDMAFLRKRPYWVAEKSDGERVLLLSLSSGSYLVDPSFNIYKVKDAPNGGDRARFLLPKVGDINTPQDKTLLDCVLVWNHAFGKPALMVIDVYAVEGERIAVKYMRSRIDAIRDKVVAPMRSRYPPNSPAENALQVVMLGKEYFPIDRLNVLFERLSCIPDETGPRFLYHFEKRYNENDGIVFVPDEKPLRPGLREEVKKWKWPEITSVVFSIEMAIEQRVDNRPDRVTFFARLGGNKGELLDYREINFRTQDRDRFILAVRDFYFPEAAQPTYPFTVLAECTYDYKNGEWTYLRLRGDKTLPTYYAQAFNQLEATAERLTKEDLLKGLDIRNQHRPVSNPATPATPMTPAVVDKQLQHNYPNDDTSESPFVNGNGSGSGHAHSAQGTKRQLSDVYDNSSQPSSDAKRQRTQDHPNHPHSHQ